MHPSVCYCIHPFHLPLHPAICCCIHPSRIMNRGGINNFRSPVTIILKVAVLLWWWMTLTPSTSSKVIKIVWPPPHPCCHRQHHTRTDCDFQAAGTDPVSRPQQGRACAWNILTENAKGASTLTLWLFRSGQERQSRTFLGYTVAMVRSVLERMRTRCCTALTKAQADRLESIRRRALGMSYPGQAHA